MNKKKILDAWNALDNIKEKSAKLSSIVSEFDVIKNDLSNLKDEIQKAKKINKDSKAELSKLNKTVDEVQDKLISEIRVRIAEGAAEQTSLIKDANEKLSKIEANLDETQSEVDETRIDIKELNNNINKMNKSLLSYKKISTILQIISLAAIVYFITRSLGIIWWLVHWIK